MRVATTLLAFVFAVPIISSAALGHFVWINVVQKDSSAPQVEVYFSETPDPDDPQLIEKIAGTKVFARPTTSDAAQAIALKEVREELTGKLVGAAPAGKSLYLEAICDYG